MAASAILAAHPLVRQLGQHDDVPMLHKGPYDAEPITRTSSDSGSSDSGVLPNLAGSDTAVSSASSTELESPTDGEADCDLDGVSTGIPSPFILSPRRLDTPCTPLLARECGGRFPFPTMVDEDAGYDSDSDKKAFKRLPRPAPIRPRLLRSGSANWHPRLLQSQEGGRNRSRSLLAPVSPSIDAPAPAAVTPPLPTPPSPTLVRVDRPTKIDLPPPSLSKEVAQARLGRGLPSSFVVARRAVSESVPVAPRLCATPDEPRSPSPLDLPSPLSVARHPSSPVVRRGRSSSVAGLVGPGSPQPLSSPTPIPPRLMRRLATNNVKHAAHLPCVAGLVGPNSPQVPSSPAPIPPRLMRCLATDNVKHAAHLPCAPRRVFQQQRSMLVPRDAPPRPALWRKPDTPVDEVKSAAAVGERNPYFDFAIIVPGVGAMLDPSAPSTMCLA